MSVARRLPPVPAEFALLYEFANSLDLRRFAEGGAPHRAGDKLATVEALEAWMRGRGLLEKGVRLSRSDHEKVLELRSALRSFLQLAPLSRYAGADVARLNAAAANFSLIVEVSESVGTRLRPQHRSVLSGLGAILADLHHAAESALRDKGYPNKPDPAKVNIPMTILTLIALMTFGVMVYAPLAAVLVEMFPARIRYTSMSLPYHVGNGWFGGFLPASVFAIVAAKGDMYAGLWYPIIIAAVSFLVAALFLDETKGADINRND